MIQILRALVAAAAVIGVIAVSPNASYAQQDQAPAAPKTTINLNTATDEDILTIPGLGQRMLREFKEYRPWKTKAQFDKEIGKYVGDKETARLWRFVTIQ